MSKQPRMMNPRVLLVVGLIFGSALAVTGCGGGGSGSGQKSQNNPSRKSDAVTDGSPKTSGISSSAANPSAILAQVKGEKGIVVVVNSAVRESGGFATVEGAITNTGATEFDAVSWRGQETALVNSGPSVAGAALVDQAGKKRYYVLRDTDGKCLCTMGLISIKPKESRPFFAQFPAPPQGTTEVEFQLPTMPPAKIQISEG